MRISWIIYLVSFVSESKPNKLPNIIFGDNLEIETGVPGHSWKSSYVGWNNFVLRLKAAGGSARMLHLPTLGIRGNSHVPMMDTNNRDIADLILEWLETTKN